MLISFFKGAVSGPISYRYFSDEAMLGQVLYGFIQQGVVNFHEFLVRQVLYFKVTQVEKGKISIT